MQGDSSGDYLLDAPPTGNSEGANMSYLTSCNYCLLERFKNRIENLGKKVEVRPSQKDGMEGWLSPPPTP